MRTIQSLLSLILLSLAFSACDPDKGFTSLMNGKDLTGWYPYIQNHTPGYDSLGVFTIDPDGSLHVSGEYFAYVATTRTYKDFHLKLEFKWGEKKYAPRLDKQRDSGICYWFANGKPDLIWPRSIECQIQEGDVGDLWMIDSAYVTHQGKRTEPGNFIRAQKLKDAEKPNGEWNTVEVICSGGHIQHIVNGVLVNEATEPSESEGKILLQSEGAELYYRNIKIKEL